MEKQSKKVINNKGFTLVELLIAITILVVIVVPILASIVTSMKVNKKSDDLLNETAVAQTFMEGMQNMKLEEIAEQFSDVTNAGAALSFLPAGMGGTVHKEYQNSFTLNNGSYVFQKSTTGNVYTFGVKDVVYDNKKYDVKVTLDASDYYRTATPSPELYNDKLYVDIADYDSDYDGLYVQNSTINADLCAELALRCVTANNYKTADDIEQEADRTITLNINSKPSVTPLAGNAPVIEAGVNYKLEIPESYVGSTVKNSDSQEFNALYKNTKNTDKKPRNIYLLYNPNYNSVSSHERDHIVINNPENIPVTVYVIKQSSIEEYNQRSAEAKYRVDIKVVEGAKGSEYATKIRTNVGYNLYDLLKTNIYKEETQQARLEYECAGTSYTEDIYTTAEKIVGGSNETVRIFKAKVEVYKDGSYASNFGGAPLATLDSEVSGSAASVTATTTP